MTKLEVILSFRMSTKCSWRNLDYIRLHLNKAKNGISMAITHEERGSNKFSRFGIA
jgi:hypothetical protein